MQPAALGYDPKNWLSLLLDVPPSRVFRTNTAHDRWWEGRRPWGQLVNASRGMPHQLDAMLGDSTARTQTRQRYAALLAAFPASLARHLRAPGSVTGD